MRKIINREDIQLPVAASLAATQDEAQMPPSATTSIDSLARHIARPVRGCATDEQYADVVQRATDALTAAAETLIRATAKPSGAAGADAVNERVTSPLLLRLLLKSWSVCVSGRQILRSARLRCVLKIFRSMSTFVTLSPN